MRAWNFSIIVQRSANVEINGEGDPKNSRSYINFHLPSPKNKLLSPIHSLKQPAITRVSIENSTCCKVCSNEKQPVDSNAIKVLSTTSTIRHDLWLPTKCRYFNHYSCNISKQHHHFSQLINCEIVIKLGLFYRFNRVWSLFKSLDACKVMLMDVLDDTKKPIPCIEFLIRSSIIIHLLLRLEDERMKSTGLWWLRLWLVK